MDDENASIPPVADELGAGGGFDEELPMMLLPYYDTIQNESFGTTSCCLLITFLMIVGGRHFLCRRDST